jgi:hypothetical protein
VIDASSTASFREGWYRLAGTRELTRELRPAGRPS